MKNLLRNFIFTIFFLITCGLHAQDVSLIISAGANYSGMSVKGGNTTRQIGYRFSILPEYSLANDFFIRSGIELSQKRSEINISRLVDLNRDIYIDYMAIYDKYTPLYLQVPLVVGKRTTVNKVKLALVAGLYYGYGLSGKLYRMKGLDISLSLEDIVAALSSAYDLPHVEAYYYKFFSSEGFKRYDLGLSLNAEAEYANFLFRVGYEHGLTNISRGHIAVRNRNFFVTLGYRLPAF